MELVRWRVDRFPMTKDITDDWARKQLNESTRGNTLDEVREMRNLIIRDKDRSTGIIKREINQFLVEGAGLANLFYVDKNRDDDKHECVTIENLKMSWKGNGGIDNIEKFAWLFHSWGSTVFHWNTKLTHQEYTELLVLKECNAYYAGGFEKRSQKTSVQHLYTTIMNNAKNNIMRVNRAGKHYHDSIWTIESKEGNTTRKKENSISIFNLKGVSDLMTRPEIVIGKAMNDGLYTEVSI